jgi:hypothetical protein
MNSLKKPYFVLGNTDELGYKNGLDKFVVF